MSYDVSVFRDERVTPQQRFAPQVLADALDSGRTITGPRKVAQRVCLQLMTRLGSVPQSDAGCGFVDSLVLGNVTTEQDVFVAFATAVTTVVNKVQAEQLEDDPDDEKLEGIAVRSLVLTPGTVTLNVDLLLASGESSPLNVPLNFLVA